MGQRAQQAWPRTLVTVVALLQLVLGVIAAFTLSTPGAVAGLPPVSPAPTPDPAPAAAPAPVLVPGETDAADAVVPKVDLFAAAGAASPSGSLNNPTWENVPLVLHVIEDRGPWLHVQVNTRPNGATAWVHRSDVALRRVPDRIVVEVGARRLTVLHGNEVLATHPVAVGSPSTPTPLGEFYVDATVRLAGTGGPYGAGQLSVSGFSEVLKRFGGGIGQIAIHGTNNTKSIGSAVSNGCIRMLNSAWLQVAAMAPNGTPVSIRA